MILKLTKSTVVCFLLFLAMMITPASGWSQEHGAGGQGAQTEISDDEIATFAKAQNQVANIRQNYQGRLSDVKDQAEQQKIVQEMNEKMVAALQQQGLSVKRYNEIINASLYDPELEKRITEAMQKTR